MLKRKLRSKETTLFLSPLITFPCALMISYLLSLSFVLVLFTSFCHGFVLNSHVCVFFGLTKMETFHLFL